MPNFMHGLNQPCRYGCSSVSDTGASIAARLICAIQIMMWRLFEASLQETAGLAQVLDVTAKKLKSSSQNNQII